MPSDSEVCEFGLFKEIFGMLLNWAGKTDETGMLAETYFDLLSPSNPTEKEVMAAISAHIDNQPPSLPSARTLKEIIWSDRKTSQQALPPANPANLKVEASRENRLMAIAAIYKHQGNTPFYRSVLSGKEGCWSVLIDPRGSISHENVLAFIEGDEIGSRREAV